MLLDDGSSITENPQEPITKLPKPSQPRRSTATPPVPGGPTETTVTPPWEQPTGAGMGGLTRTGTLADITGTMRALGLDKDYFAEAQKMLPPPPEIPGMTKKGWAALAIPLGLAALTGGPMGLAAVGNAVGQAGATTANARQQNWENQYRYATGLGSLANTMQARGTSLLNALLPYEYMKQGEAGRLQEMDLTRLDRKAQWSIQNEFTAQRLGTELKRVKGMEKYQNELSQYRQASLDSLNAFRQGELYLQSGKLDLARQAFALAQTKEADMQGYRSQLIGVATQRLGTARDAETITASRAILNSLLYQYQTLESSNPTDPGLPGLLQDIDVLQQAIAQTGNVLSGSPGAPGGPTSGPGMMTLPGTYVGTDNRTGHPVYKNSAGQYIDGVTGEVLK